MSNSNDRRERRQRTDIYPCAFFFFFCLRSPTFFLPSSFTHTSGTIQSGSSKVWIFDDRCGRGSFECRRRAYRRFLSKIESPAVRRHHFQTYIPTNAYVRMCVRARTNGKPHSRRGSRGMTRGVIGRNDDDDTKNRPFLALQRDAMLIIAAALPWRARLTIDSKWPPPLRNRMHASVRIVVPWYRLEDKSIRDEISLADKMHRGATRSTHTHRETHAHTENGRARARAHARTRLARTRRGRGYAPRTAYFL